MKRKDGMGQYKWGQDRRWRGSRRAFEKLIKAMLENDMWKRVTLHTN